MDLAVLPLAITMNAGPQIMSALIFITASKPLKLSAAFLAGVVIAVTRGLTLTYTLRQRCSATASPLATHQITDRSAT